MRVHTIKVWGDYACFTRPETGTERYSYPCMTPSAARGVLDSIYVKPPAFRWQVTSIAVLTEPVFVGMRANEVKTKASTRKEMIDIASDRTQRQTVMLRSPAYLISAYIRPWREDDDVVKYDAQFVRRASKGQCFQQPWLGLRELAAYFSHVRPEDAPTPIDVTCDLGMMVYDVFDLSQPGVHPPSPSVFKASLERGVMTVPAFDSPDVHKVQS